MPASGAVLVVPVTDVQRLAAACALVRVDAVVAPLDGAGCGVVLDDADGAEGAAQRLSKVLGQADLMLFVRREGQVTATRWVGGARVERPAAGVALSCLPDAAERLVLGGEPGEGSVSSRGMSRMEAARAAVAGSPAEAAWAARARRWERVVSLALLAVLVLLVAWQVMETAAGGGSPVLLGVGLAALGLLGVRELRRRRAP